MDRLGCADGSAVAVGALRPVREGPVRRRLCLIGLHRWRKTGVGILLERNQQWLPERMCSRCGRIELPL